MKNFVRYPLKTRELTSFRNHNMPTKKESGVEKQKAWRQIETITGNLIKSVGHRPDWRTTQDNALSIQVTFSKYEQQFYDVSDADFERWKSYKVAFVVFLVGDCENALVVPADELKKHIKAEHRQPSEEYADYKLHLIKGTDAYAFRELPNLNLIKYHNAYHLLRRA